MHVLPLNPFKRDLFFRRQAHIPPALSWGIDRVAFGHRPNTDPLTAEEEMALHQRRAARDEAGQPTADALEAHRELIQRYYFLWANWVRRLCGRGLPQDDAEDIVSQTFTKLLNSPTQFQPQPGKRYDAFIAVAVLNQQSSYFRKIVRRQEYLRELLLKLSGDGFDLPEKTLVEAVQTEWIFTLLELQWGTLTPFQQQAIEFYLEHGNYKEAADAAGIPVETFKNRLHHARLKLRKASGNSSRK